MRKNLFLMMVATIAFGEGSAFAAGVEGACAKNIEGFKGIKVPVPPKNPGAKQEIQALFRHQLELASAASKGELDESKLHSDAFVSHAQDL